MAMTHTPPSDAANGPRDARRRSPRATLIVEDDPAFADTLQSALLKTQVLSPVHVASRLDSARRMADQTAYGLSIIDLNLPDGDGCSLIEEFAARTTCIVLTVSGREADVVRAIRAGASGYLLKDEPELVPQVLSVASGSFPISARIAAHLVRHWRAVDSSGNEPEPTALNGERSLSNRELDVLTVLAQGHTYQETAERLKISPHTVADHVKNIYRKLAVNSRSGAVYRASQLGYLDLANTS